MKRITSRDLVDISFHSSYPTTRPRKTIEYQNNSSYRPLPHTLASSPHSQGSKHVVAPTSSPKSHGNRLYGMVSRSRTVHQRPTLPGQARGLAREDDRGSTGCYYRNLLVHPAASLSNGSLILWKADDPDLPVLVAIDRSVIDFEIPSFSLPLPPFLSTPPPPAPPPPPPPPLVFHKAVIQRVTQFTSDHPYVTSIVGVGLGVGVVGYGVGKEVKRRETGREGRRGRVVDGFMVDAVRECLVFLFPSPPYSIRTDRLIYSCPDNL